MADLPESTEFVERLPELTKKGDRHKTKGHRHYAAPCDKCGEITLVVAERKCRMTPGCEGSHRKPR